MIPMLVVLVTFPVSSQAQEVRHVYEVMEGFKDNAGNTSPLTRSSASRPLPPPNGWTRPATPSNIASTFVVTTTADAGAGSLRAAIISSNGNPGLDVITFNIPGSGVQTITPLTSFPTITGPVIIDGTTQPGYSGAPLIELNGGSAPLGTNGLYLTGGSSIVQGLAINRFKRFATGGNGYAIVLDVAGGNFIQANYIGLNAAGTAALPNGSGVGMFGGSGGNTIGGTTPGSGNVISGNLSTAVAIASGSAGGNIVEGNYIGTNAAGNVAVGNGGNGVFMDAPNNRVGGLISAAWNVVSGNAFPGVFIGTNASGNVVQGNNIGTDASGYILLGNASNGINIRSSNNVIGDASINGTNIIAGSGSAGIYVFSATATDNTIINNYIGTDPSASVAFPNVKGMVFDTAPGNTVDGNVICGNTLYGIDILNTGAAGNKIINNIIGPPWGDVSLGNTSHGIRIAASQDTIMDNSVAYNGGSGVYDSSGTQNLITGNSIFGNAGMGIEIRNTGVAGDKIMNNFIGTDSQLSALGNGSDGILINASRDTIKVNTIAYNNGSGVRVASGTQNLIVENPIFSNTGLGIDLGSTGLTINDTLDPDVGGNNLQNFPLLDSARTVGSNLVVHWRFNGKPNTKFTLDFYSNDVAHSSHFGEGKNHRLSTPTYVTDAGGNVDSSSAFPFTSTEKFITATATDSAGNTSEFSQALCLSDIDGDGIMDSWETQGWGIDVNGDGVIDQDLWLMGARPNHKDIFVEVDAMNGFAPPDRALEMVQASFDRVPNIYVSNPDGQGGIKLHYILDDTTIQVQDFPLTFVDFTLVKNSNFGTAAERNPANTNRTNILAAKDLVYRYCIFARTFGIGNDTLASGIAELANGLGGNDFMVTFGSTGPSGWYATKNVEDNAGTFMHELGHTLGLGHGGDQLYENYKPNYLSVMNYTWQTPHNAWKTQSWQPNYSPVALPTMIEASLNETVGLNPPAGIYKYIPVPYTDSLLNIRYARLKPGAKADWNWNGTYGTSVNADINRLGDTTRTPNETLTGYADWPNLQYNFRNSPDFKPWVSDRPNVLVRELTKEINNRLDSLPPPKPYGQFIMDGQLDTSAILIGTNGGVNLYASYKEGQLYVATSSAQSQGADMYIFISDARNSLQNAPGGKTGQVAAWSVYLSNKNADNSAEWNDTLGVPLTNITVDTVGSVLEGVIDIELLYGSTPTDLFIAVGKYGTAPGGSLLTQVPFGDGDGNIDPAELFWFIGAPVPPYLYFTQQGGKLVGSGSVGPYGSYQGHGAALSGDGNTAIVGGPGDNNFLGAAWVFTRSGGLWNQQGSKLVGTGALHPDASQGNSVALSADGNTAIVGGPDDWHNGNGSNNSGSAWIFTRSGSVWTQQGIRLFDSSATSNQGIRQGCSVGISGDGNTAIVGGLNDAASVGAAWIYTRNGNVWTKRAKLVGTGAIGNGAAQGWSVTLSGDGHTALVGGPVDNAAKGAVWVYTLTGSSWSQQAKLVGSGAVGTSLQGSSVSLSSDGNTALVGGYQDNNQVGAVWVFKRTGGVWTQEGGKLVGSGAAGGAAQGHSVSLSSDGNLAIVGGPFDAASTGAVWVFTRAGGVWSQQGDKINGTGAVGSIPQQGTSVSISADGQTAIVGGIGDNANTGAAWVFTHDSPLPIQLASFVATVVNGISIRLDWITMTETNNYGFEIQRSPENGNNYQSLPNSFIPGHGTTNEPQHYSFMDVSVLPGQWYYRLKQIDLDGAVHYSDGIAINTLTGISGSQLPEKFGLSQNYPDPFNPVTTIQYQLPQVAHVTLKIYNVLGQEVVTLADDVEAAGYKSVIWNAGSVASGVYLYRIVMASGQTTFVDVRKMLVLK
jgi:hypothetical protein